MEISLESLMMKGDVTRDDSQWRFLVQHFVAMLEQCWNLWKVWTEESFQKQVELDRPGERSPE